MNQKYACFKEELYLGGHAALPGPPHPSQLALLLSGLEGLLLDLPGQLPNQFPVLVELDL